MKKVLIVVGTRPNFIKVTQFKKVAANFPNIDLRIVHTGQHYDQNMSSVFFDQFKLTPDHFLNVGRATVNKQMAEIIHKIDDVVEEIKPDMLLAVGDVNSTLCASIVANKRDILLGHIESGLRSRDRSMPEEINRILTDEITDHFFVTEESGLENLKEEGKKQEHIHFVGNTMIDTLVAFQKEIDKSGVLEEHNLTKGKFILLTMHRPSNVDDVENLTKVVQLVENMSRINTVVFPVHPRTINKLKELELWSRFENIENLIQLPPMDYFAFQKLIANAKVVVTDSGGIQEETTFKQVPCLTIRNNTERPSTTTIGTNQLLEFDVDKITKIVGNSDFKEGIIPELWDGNSTRRIMEKIEEILN